MLKSVIRKRSNFKIIQRWLRLNISTFIGIVAVCGFLPMTVNAANQYWSFAYSYSYYSPGDGFPYASTPQEACQQMIDWRNRTDYARTDGYHLYVTFKDMDWAERDIFSYHPGSLYVCHTNRHVTADDGGQWDVNIDEAIYIINLPPSAPQNEKNMGSPSEGSCQGNPCNAGNGNKTQQEMDFIGEGAFPLRAQRAYNSGVSASSILLGAKWGAKWSGFYDRSVPIGTFNTHANSVVARRQDGTAHTFSVTAGVVVGDSDVNGQLVATGFDSNGAPLGWTYLNENDEWESYSASGQLLSITNSAGLTQTLTYSDGTTGLGGGLVLTSAGVETSTALPAGLLVKVTDPQGRSLKYGYDSVERVVRMIDPTGGIYTYAYDDANSLSADLISVTYPDGHARQYLYGEVSHVSSTPSQFFSYKNALTGIVDETGNRFASWTFDSAGRATSSEHGAFGSGIDYVGLSYGAVSSGASSTVVTDALGTTRTYNFNTILGVVKNSGISGPPCKGCTAGFAYDSNGNIAKRTDFSGSSSCYAYDLNRNLETMRVEGLASGKACPSDLTTYVPAAGTVERKAVTAWHPSLRIPVQRAEPLKLSTWVYNGQPDPTNGNAAASCAPSSALLPGGAPIAVLCKQIEQATTDATGASGLSATTTGTARISSWTYDAQGQILTATDPLNHVTSYTYYTSTALSGTVPNQVGHTLGDLASVTNPAGQVTTFDLYDPVGRVLQSTNPKGVVTTATYYPRGWIHTVSTTALGGVTRTTTYSYDGVGQLIGVSNPDGSALSFSYDAAHRLIGASDGRGNTVTYTLDNMGNRIFEQVKDSSGNLQRSIARSFDTLNRMQQVSGATQ